MTSAEAVSGTDADPPGRARRTDPRRGRTRAALVAAAQALLAQNRSEVSIQEITGTAGVGFGSFYNHFDTKGELFAAAVSETLRAHGDLVRAVSSDIDDPAEVFCIGLRLSGRLQRTFPQLARVLLNTGMATLLSDQGGLMAHARRDLAAAVEMGRFDVSSVDLALHVAAGSLIALIAQLDNHPDADADLLADEYAICILRGVGLTQDEARRLASRPLPPLPYPSRPTIRRRASR